MTIHAVLFEGNTQLWDSNSPEGRHSVVRKQGRTYIVEEHKTEYDYFHTPAKSITPFNNYDKAHHHAVWWIQNQEGA